MGARERALLHRHRQQAELWPGDVEITGRAEAKMALQQPKEKIEKHAEKVVNDDKLLCYKQGAKTAVHLD